MPAFFLDLCLFLFISSLSLDRRFREEGSAPERARRHLTAVPNPVDSTDFLARYYIIIIITIIILVMCVRTTA